MEMGDPFPPEVGDLLRASDAAERDTAWGRFAEKHSRLLLHVARSMSRDQDEAMDAYAWVLEHLREDGGRRLASYTGRHGSRFTTWLVVVARRSCVDFLRQRRGRARGGEEGDGVNPAGLFVRRRLLALAEAAPLPEALTDGKEDPATAAAVAERDRLVHEVLEGLDPRDRLLLALRFDDGVSAPEIARLMGFPSPFHVYRRLNRLLPELREQLIRRGMEGKDG